MTEPESPRADATSLPKGFLSTELFASLVVSTLYVAVFALLFFSYVI